MNSPLTPYIEEYDLLTPEELEYITNGCGPKFGSLYRLVPDFCGLYTPACDFHDWIYWSGGPPEIRYEGDKKMKRDMAHENSKLSRWKRWALLWTPRVYYSVVRRVGEVAFHKAVKRRTRADLRREMSHGGIQ